tara:strand:- start:3383 stop:4879 length:1497 start_codon:yes stop_codon:yes gene_type:complete
MKKVLIIVAALLALIFVAIPITTRVLGPRLILVDAPSGNPIGEFDIPRPETSLLAVSIGVPMTMLSELANTNVPLEFEGSEQKDFHKNIKGGGYAWKAARGPITFQNSGTNLGFATEIQGAAQFQGNLDAKIIQIPLNSTAQLAGVAGGTLSPSIAPDWSIIPNLVPALNLSQASLSLGGIGQIDISDILGGSIGQYVQKEAQRLAPSLQNSLNLRDQVDQLWRQAYLTEMVNDDPVIWISVTPQQVHLAPIDYSDPEQLSVTVAIQSETFLTNRKPDIAQAIPLPDLVAHETPLTTNLNLPVIVSISELNTMLKDETFEIDSGAGTSLKISGIEAEVGQAGMLNLKLSLKASQNSLARGIEGEIWIQGSPVIDFENQSLGFTNIDFTVETRSQLTSIAAWLMEELLIKSLEKELRVNLDDYKEELHEEVQKAIASADLPAGIDVSVQDLNIQLADIYTITRPFPDAPDSPGIVVVINATGNLQTQINQILLNDLPGI